MTWQDPVSGLTGRCFEKGILLEFSGIGSVMINVADRRVSFLDDEIGKEDSTNSHLLTDQVLPRLLDYDGKLVLHASAVSVSNLALVFVGPSGHGKSTLTASLTQHGFSLLSDDALVVDLRPPVSVRAVYPSLRLMPDSLRALYPENVATEPMAEYSPKRRLPVDASGDPEPHPLKLMVFLDPPGPTEEIALRPMTQAEACMGLIANSFALDPTNRPRAAKRLAQASALAAAVPAFALSYPRRYECLPSVIEAISQTLDTACKAPALAPTP